MEESFIIQKIRDESTRHYGFNLMLKSYQERVYWHVRKMVIDHDDAADLTQEIFVKVWTNLHKFREDSSLFTWIYRIATNESLNFLQKKKRRHLLRLSDVSTELASKIDENILISGDEIQLKLQKALLKLPDKQRAVFNMKYYDEMKFAEISEVTGTSIGALKASYHIAVKKIEALLSED
ncbi:MAG: RNA polymerase sigma factor [Cyclobacteriaceae bacterium]